MTMPAVGSEFAEEPAYLEEKINPFSLARRYIDDAAGVLDLEPAMRALLREPQREMQAALPVRMEDGSVQVIKAFRVHYNGARGPCRGSIRYHPAETIETVRAIAAWATGQAAVADLPLGGGSGGIACRPWELRGEECRRLFEAYTREFACVLHPEEQAVTAPPGHTQADVVAWMADALSPGCGCADAVERPAPPGAVLGRNDAAARGAMIAVSEAARALGIDLAGATAAIQGYGRAGRRVHRLAVEMLGLKVVAVSDARGGSHNPAGLDHAALAAYKERRGTVAGFPRSHEIDNATLLELPVTVLFLAALEDQVAATNAGQVHARIVAELATQGASLEADHTLHRRGVYLIPDLVCSAGAALAGYAEFVLDRPYDEWDAATVQAHLDDRIRRAFRDVHVTIERYGIRHKLAAHVVALERVAAAVRERGWV